MPLQARHWQGWIFLLSLADDAVAMTAFFIALKAKQGNTVSRGESNDHVVRTSRSVVQVTEVASPPCYGVAVAERVPVLPWVP